MSDFYKNRIAFALVKGELVFQEIYDHRSSKEWLSRTYGIGDKEFECTVRGGVFSDYITLCQGSDYLPIDLELLPASVLIDIVHKHNDLYGTKPVEIQNGQVPGEVGEKWQCRESLGYFQYYIK